MFQWMNFRSEPKKATFVEQTLDIINFFFRKFFCTGSWFVYFLALSFFVLGLMYYFIDEAKKRHLRERRREIRRAQERPPQKRRPGAAARNHEIYRSVMGKVREHIEPSCNQTYVFRQTRSGQVYGQVIGPAKTIPNQEQANKRESMEIDAETENSEVPKIVFH